MEGKKNAKTIKAKEEEIKTLQTRLSDLENELDKRNIELKTVKSQREQIVGELNHFQRELKTAKSQQTAAEDAEAQAKNYADEMKVRIYDVLASSNTYTLQAEMKKLEATLKDSSTSNKCVVSQLQQEIIRLKSECKDYQEKLGSCQEESRFKDDFIKQVEDDRDRIRRDYSSKLANLEQALQSEKKKEKNLKSKVTELEDQLLTMQRDDSIDKKSDSMQMASLLTPQKYHNLGHLEGELEELKSENSKLKRDYEFFYNNYTMVCEKSQSYKQSIADSKKEIERLQDMLDVVNNDKESLQQQVEQLQAKLNTQTEQLADEDKHQQQLQQINEQLKERTSQLQQSNLMVDELKLELQTTRNKDTTDQPDIEQLYQEMLLLQGELDVAKAETKAATDKLAVLVQEKTSLMETKDEISKDNVVLKDQVKCLECDFAELHKKFTALTSVHNELVESFETSEDVTPYKTPRKPLAVVEELHDKLKSAGKENETLKHQNQSVASSRDLLQIQLKGAKHTIDKLKKEMYQIENTSNSIKSESDAEFKNTKEKLQSTREALVVAHEEIDKFSIKLAELQLRAKDAEQQVEQLMKKSDELEKENFELTYSLSVAQEEANAAKKLSKELSDEMGKIDKKCEAMEKKSVERESVIKELILSNDLMESENTSLLSQISSLTQAIKDKTNHLFTAQDKLNAQKVTAAEAENIIAMLDQTLKDAQRDKQVSEDHITQLQATLTSTKEQLAAVKDGYSQLEERMTNMAAEFEELQRDKQSLNWLVKKAAQERDDLVRQKAELEIQISNDAKTKEQDMKSLQRQVQEKDWENNRLLQEQVTIQQSYKELQAKCSVMESKCANLQDGYSVLKQESLANGEESKTIQQHLQVLQRKCDDLQAENYQLKDYTTKTEEQKAKNEELGIKLMQQNAKVKQLTKMNELLTRKYRCLQEDFENIQASQYAISPRHTDQPSDEVAKQSSDDKNKVLFAVQNTMTFSYK